MKKQVEILKITGILDNAFKQNYRKFNNLCHSISPSPSYGNKSITIVKYRTKNQRQKMQSIRLHATLEKQDIFVDVKIQSTSTKFFLIYTQMDPTVPIKETGNQLR
jgi:hypothetical protein